MSKNHDFVYTGGPVLQITEQEHPALDRKSVV